METWFIGTGVISEVTVIHFFIYICYPFWATESTKHEKSQLLYHRGDCLTEIDFYGPRALVLPPADLNWRPSLEWTWTDSGHSQHVLAEGKPQQAWICMQVHTGLVLSRPLPPPNPVWSLGNHCTLFQPGLQVQIMLCISKHSLFSIRNVYEISGIWN